MSREPQRTKHRTKNVQRIIQKSRTVEAIAHKNQKRARQGSQIHKRTIETEKDHEGRIEPLSSFSKLELISGAGNGLKQDQLILIFQILFYG
jgi:hypothetical protein